MPETARSKPLEIWFQDEARVGQQGTLTRIWAERGTRPRAPRDTRYIWSYIFGAVCPERAEAAALIMPHADTQAMSAHLAEIAKTVASGAHALLILDGAGWHGSADLEVPDNITLLKLPPGHAKHQPSNGTNRRRAWTIPLNSTRWKMCGLICVPTSSPYPSSTIMSRSSTGVAKHGTSLQTTKPQSRQSLPDNGPKRSTTRAVGIMSNFDHSTQSALPNNRVPSAMPV